MFFMFLKKKMMSHRSPADADVERSVVGLAAIKPRRNRAGTRSPEWFTGHTLAMVEARISMRLSHLMNLHGKLCGILQVQANKQR
jgi:hypothetical protein